MTQELTTYQSRAPLTPANMDQAMKLADMMAQSALVPKDLQGKPADCLLVIEQAMRWEMSPFAVAQSTSVIHGKLMYEGKLVAAVVNTRPELDRRLTYTYSGDGDNRTVTVKGKLKNEDEQQISVTLKDVKTSNQIWAKQPDQQLAYSGARIWARRHMPEAMLGVYVPEEDFIDNTPQPASMSAVEIGKGITIENTATEPPKEPYFIPVPVIPEGGASNWTVWGTQLAAGLNASKTSEELDEWILKNGDALKIAATDAEKIHARLTKVYEMNMQRILG